MEDLQDENYPEHYKLSLKAKLEVKQQSNEVIDVVAERPRPTNRPVVAKARTTTTTTKTPTQRVTFPKLNRATEAPVRNLDHSGILPSAAGVEELPTSNPSSPKYSSRIRQSENRAQEPSHKLRPRSQNPGQNQRNPNLLDGHGRETATVVAKEENVAPVI